MLYCFCVFQRKIRGQELLGKVCDNLNLVEKDYFGLLYEDRGDPRIWIDLEKRVSKMVKRKILFHMFFSSDDLELWDFFLECVYRSISLRKLVTVFKLHFEIMSFLRRFQMMQVKHVLNIYFFHTTLMI